MGLEALESGCRPISVLTVEPEVGVVLHTALAANDGKGAARPEALKPQTPCPKFMLPESALEAPTRGYRP